MDSQKSIYYWGVEDCTQLVVTPQDDKTFLFEIMDVSGLVIGSITLEGFRVGKLKALIEENS